MGQTHDQVFTQLVRGYRFIMRDNGLDIQLKIKTIGAIFC